MPANVACVFIALLLLGPVTGLAGDADGRFAIKGFGLRTCGDFLTARHEQSADYHRFGGWLNGYLTASNRYEPATFDLASWQGTPIMAAWLAEYCAKQPKALFIDAVGALVNRLGADRLQAFSEPAGLPGQPISLVYISTVHRVQERLAELEHFTAPASGAFDDATRDALRAYQAANGLDPTGLPDQPTLALLLQPGRPDSDGEP
jgi:hypothetical protein